MPVKVNKFTCKHKSINEIYFSFPIAFIRAFLINLYKHLYRFVNTS